MNISGILVVSRPEHTEHVRARLQELAGIDVHYVDAPRGRLVITQEAESIQDEVEGLKRIRALPGILLAELSCHYFEEDRELLDGIPPELEEEGLEAACVPAFLND